MKKHLDLIKELRMMTSSSIADCKKAIEEAGGDLKKAQELLRKRGLEIAAKKQARSTREGRVEAYIHTGNKIGVLLEVGCETDFVAKNSDFAQFTKDVAMQVAATSPAYLKREDVPAEIAEQEKGNEQFFKEHCLLEQPFIKDPSITIKDYLSSLVAKVGENIIVHKFIRYRVGE
ncbi:MAG: elongation factor Ts [Candidatus Omnitrophica bacterium]|nr:elongation factor Ts [Candidatus Omnitrophota bacterium]